LARWRSGFCVPAHNFISSCPCCYCQCGVSYSHCKLTWPPSCLLLAQFSHGCHRHNAVGAGQSPLHPHGHKAARAWQGPLHLLRLPASNVAHDYKDYAHAQATSKETKGSHHSDWDFKASRSLGSHKSSRRRDGHGAISCRRDGHGAILDRYVSDQHIRRVCP